MQGYIGLHRKLMENPVWSDPNYLKLWIYCLFKASHKEHDQLLGNQIVKIERGQFVTGRKVLSSDMNKGVKPDQMLSEKSWERYLKNLEKWQMLTIKVTNKYSVVTIGNYDFYQGTGGQVDQVVDQQLTNKSPATDQQLTTNNNVNKGKNENKLKDYTTEIKEFLARYQNIEGFNKLNKDYWDVIRETRTTGKVSQSIISTNMSKWEKYDPVVVQYSLKSHIEAHAGKKEGYTIGIMRGTTPEEAEDRLNSKASYIPGSKQKVDTKSIFDEFKNMED